MIEIEEAFQLLLANVAPLPAETIALKKSVGRVLAQPITADFDSPPHRKSLMDGFAVRSTDINSGCRRLRVTETIVAGGWPEEAITDGEAARIMTGAPLPEGADAVVMIEKVVIEGTEKSMGGQSTRPDRLLNSDSSYINVLVDQLGPNQHVAQRGDNFQAGQILFPKGHRIRPTDIGLMAEAGAVCPAVVKRPGVSVLPTGDELVDCSEVPRRGQIRNSNGPMLAAMVERLGLESNLLPICRDDADALEAAIVSGLKNDLLLLTGGVSEGMLDLVPRTLQRLGVQEIFHKVRIKPGKPIWFGVQRTPEKVSESWKQENTLSHNATQKCVFGLPGNPVSSLVGFELFVKTAIRMMESVGARSEFATDLSSDHPALPRPDRAVLTKDHASRVDRPTYWPGRLVNVDSPQRHVEPLNWKGSSDLLSLGLADGLIYFSGREELAKSGSEMLFYPFQ